MIESKYELLTKSQIMKQYNVPLAMLDEALRENRLRSIDGDKYWAGRYYIPRFQVENWIKQKSEEAFKK